MMSVQSTIACVALGAALAVPACSRRQPPATTPTPSPEAARPPVTAVPPSPAGRPATGRSDSLSTLSEDPILNRTLDDLNRDSPFRPVLFAVDSAELDEEGRLAAEDNAEILRRYTTWVITVEGHCDERGTAEYNLALGERRAVAVKTYLTSLGVAPDRIRIVSYGKEFPFDPGHNEEAWASNRRAHFVITSR